MVNLIEHEMIRGFHLEGPFISPVFPGAQPKAFILDPPMGPGEWDEVFTDPRLKLVTLAPERPGALELTTALMEAGVVVSMGHTNATFEEARRGFEFGASHTTHTYNAMRPVHHREAGIIAYALTEDALFCELIYDRLHVCREAAGLLLKCKSNDRIIAISDSTMATGLTAGTKLDMWGNPAVIGRHDVRLPDGTLAGSSITVADAFRNLHDDFGAETAIKLCCINARRSLGLNREPRIWLELDEDLAIVQIHEVPQE
jgi:N-acetylglucosamine-6-phosphate deacetylase